MAYLSVNGKETTQGYAMLKSLSLSLITREFLQRSQVTGSMKVTEVEGNTGYQIENRYYKITLGKDGRISSWLDKRTKNAFREIARKGDALNKFVIHQDVPFFWDAWDIFHYDFESAQDVYAHSLTLLSQSDHSIVFQASYTIEGDYEQERSNIKQEIVFYSDTARVDFRTQVDWNATKKLLKVYFPVSIRSDFATFDIQHGTIRRQTHANTSWDQAKYEVYAHKFCDISETKFGFAVLNNCKYGYSVRENNIGLSLLKAPKFPDHNADMCLNGKEFKEFVYSALPHERALEDSSVFSEAYQLNSPLEAAIIQHQGDQAEDEQEVLDIQKQLSDLNFIEIDSSNVALSALKKAEDGDFFVIRLNEERGEQVTVKIRFHSILEIKSVRQVNSLENDEDLEEVKTQFSFDADLGELTATLGVYRIASFALA